MKNTIFLGLALAIIHPTYAVCEDVNWDCNISLVDSLAEIKQEDYLSDKTLASFFSECYKKNNAQACQQLLALAEKKNLIDKLILSRMIIAQQQTIDTHEETIQNFNELNRRRNERINKRKEAKERELSNKLNNEN